jgi:mevalonate kinase
VALFYRARPLQPIDVSGGVHLAIGYSGEFSSTRTMVEEVARQYAGSRDRVRRVFDEMEQLALQGREALKTNDLATLGRLMDRNHNLLSGLSVSNHRLDRMCADSRAAGALGAKLTGGGGGGCIIALAPEAGVAESVTEVLREKYGEALAVRVGV